MPTPAHLPQSYDAFRCVEVPVPLIGPRRLSFADVPFLKLREFPDLEGNFWPGATGEWRRFYDNIRPGLADDMLTQRRTIAENARAKLRREWRANHPFDDDDRPWL